MVIFWGVPFFVAVMNFFSSLCLKAGINYFSSVSAQRFPVAAKKTKYSRRVRKSPRCVPLWFRNQPLQHWCPIYNLICFRRRSFLCVCVCVCVCLNKGYHFQHGVFWDSGDLENFLELLSSILSPHQFFLTLMFLWLFINNCK